MFGIWAPTVIKWLFEYRTFKYKVLYSNSSVLQITAIQIAPVVTYQIHRVWRISIGNFFSSRRHRHSLFLVVRLDNFSEQRLKRLNEIARIFNEKIRQVARWYERALAKSPSRHAEESPERFDEADNAR